LDFCQGGELFDFLQEWSQQVTEGLARRIFSELCDAVGWMHRVGLVHRDIKLENILLTRQLFPLTTSSLTSSLNPLDHLPRGGRFIKLTDFGLSRFVDPNHSQLLSTRCGSEAYAAPELLMGKLYDGTLTDSWAVGVVLYAIVTGELPFIEQPQEEGTLTMGGGEKKERGDGGLERRISSTKGGRKGYLLKIAKAEYTWPTTTTTNSRKIEIGKELKELVGKLLVRDPNKRWRIDSQQLWECEWMNKGEGKVERIEGTINRVE
jgi:serine/threonine protein kinase